MINYKYNELEYAELVFNKGFQTKHIPTELRLLVLYLRDIVGLKPKQREEAIYEFCKLHIPKFKKEKFFKTINKALKTGLKKEQKLITIPYIEISQGEIDYINSLGIVYEYKKVLFAFLVQMKLNKQIYEYKFDKKYNSIYFKGGRKKYSVIKNMSNIPQKISLNDEVINELSNKGYIQILHKGAILLKYMEYCISNGNEIIKITDFENVGLYLDYHNGIKGVKKCDKCKKIIKTKNNKQKYCDDCARELQLQWQRESMKKQRNKICEVIENSENTHE
jgi:hypothetical protein